MSDHSGLGRLSTARPINPRRGPLRRWPRVLLVLGLVATAATSTAALALRSPSAVAPRDTVGPAPAASRHADGCSWYTSPRGTVRAGGRSPHRPTTLRYATNRLIPGDVVCLEKGRYRLLESLWIRRAGTPKDWIVYRPYGNGPVVLASKFTTAGGVFQIAAPGAYLEFRDLAFDGGGTNADEAVHVLQHVHHVRVVGNVIENMGVSGVAASCSDYLTVIGNRIHRFGDGRGWGSGISLNSSCGAYWFDRRAGFHNVVARNIISGGVDNSSYHTDGNGIILDLGGAISPTLITNNLVYMNGGSGILSLQTSGVAYVVNNTLYANGLDRRVAGASELVANQASNQVWANNISVAWSGRAAYAVIDGESPTLVRDAAYAAVNVRDVAATPLSREVSQRPPLFLRRPVIDASADGQWRQAPTAAQLDDGLALAPSSPFVDTAVDPRTLPGLDSALRAGITRYTLSALDGVTRPRGKGFDYGAYER